MGMNKGHSTRYYKKISQYKVMIKKQDKAKYNNSVHWTEAIFKDLSSGLDE